MLSLFHAWVWPALTRKPIIIISAVCIPLVLILGQVSVPWFTRSLLNAIHDESHVITQALCLAAIWGGAKLIIRLQISWSAHAITDFIQEIRCKALQSILSLSYHKRSMRAPSDWTQLTLDLAKSVECIYGMIIWNILPTIGLFVIILIEVYRIHHLFFWVYFTYIVTQLYIMYRFKTKINDHSQTHNHYKNALIKNTQPLFHQALLINQTAQINQVIEHFNQFSNKEMHARNAVICTTNTVRFIMDIIAIIVFVLVLLLIIQQRHALFLGDLSFILMTLISTIDKAWSLGQNWCDLQRALGLILNHTWLAKSALTKHKNRELYNIQPLCIQIDHLSFGYPNSKPIIVNFTTRFPEKKIIGLYGKPGSGKSTLFKIISGLLAPQAGKILVNDFPIDNIDPKTRQSLINFLPQDSPHYPNLSIIENLKLSQPNASEKDIANALYQAGCQQWLYSLEHLSLLAKHLSGGQRQQLCIARAFLNPAPIWLMDESLSALDTDTHRHIMDCITNHPKIKKVLIISHQKRDQIMWESQCELPGSTFNHQSFE